MKTYPKPVFPALAFILWSGLIMMFDRHSYGFYFWSASFSVVVITLFYGINHNKSWVRLGKLARHWAREDRGAITIEYALIGALLSVAGLKSAHCLTIYCFIPIFEKIVAYMAG